MVEYFQDRCHVTKVGNTISAPIGINAFIIQGSGIGPMSYVLNSKDQKPVLPENKFSKYADDGDLVVPSVNSNLISIEIDNIQQWALQNNLTINPNKTREIIIYRQGPISTRMVPPCTPGIQRVISMKILGVEFDETLSFKKPFDISCNKAVSSMYALKILRSKGIAGVQLWDITSQTLLAQMLLCFSDVVGFSGWYIKV